MKLRLSLLVAIFLTVSGGALLIIKNPENPTKIADLVESSKDLIPIAQEIITPPPLRAPITANQIGQLTANGTFTETNNQRQINDVSPLTRNATLDKAAQNKLTDMFEKQYFEHISPNGTGPGDVVDGVGYSYVTVGENLALGNFGSDAALVEAWMNSPGHRENILKEGFREIGIAVGQGTFEGERTWLAVQTFGTPATTCTSPNKNLAKQIEDNRTKLDKLDNSLANQDSLKTELKTVQDMADKGNKKIEEGNAEIEKGNQIAQESGETEEAQAHWEKGAGLQVEGRALIEEAQERQANLQNDQAEYNNDVNEFNKLQEQTQSIIDTYNTQVAAFNTCAENLK